MRGDKETEARFVAYVEKLGCLLRTKPQRAHFATYAAGILGDSPRKSCEPIASLGAESPAEAKRRHDNLLGFLGRSVWDDHALRLCAARQAIAALEKRSEVAVWVVDDTGFPKQGKHSVGVQRQYSGTLGKTGNCQIGVSLSVATEHEQVPVDFELYLPEGWASDPIRRAAAAIPNDVGFATKIELAIDMIDRAVVAELPGSIVLADGAYGAAAHFREYILSIGKDFAVGIQGDAKVWLLDNLGQRDGDSVKPVELGVALGPKAFRRVTYRVGTKGKMSSRFCFRRVKVAGSGKKKDSEQPPLWLVIEWPEGEKKPTKFFLTSLRARMSKKEIVRIIKERWHTEQVYSELKGELGLDHFEGRSFPAWHHHITVVLCCYAFLVAERSRRFPPSDVSTDGHANQRESSAALRGFSRLAPPDPRTRSRAVAAPLSHLRPCSQCISRTLRWWSARGEKSAVVLGRARARSSRSRRRCLRSSVSPGWRSTPNSPARG